jgi:hypothetical protein
MIWIKRKTTVVKRTRPADLECMESFWGGDDRQDYAEPLLSIFHRQWFCLALAGLKPTDIFWVIKDVRNLPENNLFC